jgi:xanthine dehydrogenase YagS FAD-binding subunit
MTTFDYRRAASIDDACAQIGDAAPAYAGGTDLLTLIKAGLRAPELVVDLKHSGISDEIVDNGDQVTLGALVTLGDIERSAVLHDRLTALSEAAGVAATPQLRHRATVAGNLLQRPRCWYYRTPEVDCWLKGGADCPARAGRNEHHAIFQHGPCVAVHPSDLAGPLVALDAVVRIVGPAGTRTVPVSRLLDAPTDDRRIEHTLEPGEIITSVEIPTSQPVVSTYRKAMDRAAWAFALAGVAAAARFDGERLGDVRIVLSGVANTPHQATDSQEILVRAGRLDATTIERAAFAATTNAAPLSRNAYKARLIVALTRDALTTLATSPTRRSA